MVIFIVKLLNSSNSVLIIKFLIMNSFFVVGLFVVCVWYVKYVMNSVENNVILVFKKIQNLRIFR